jgi:uncharacterized protein YtpQ (UPF0354 family)
MKIIFAFLFFFPTLANAQVFPKNTNSIIVHGMTERELKKHLMDKGYTLIDRDSASFESLPKQIKEFNNGNIKIMAKATDTAVIVTGTFSTNEYTMLNMNGNVFYFIERHRGWDKAREAFEILNKLILSISSQVTYAKL